MFLYSDQPQTIGKVLDNGIRLFLYSFKYVFVLAFVGALITNIPSLFTPMEVPSGGIPVAPSSIVGGSIFAMVLGFIFYNGIIYRINKLAMNETVALSEAVKVGLKKLFPVIIGLILYIIALMLGIVALVIPGILVSISLLFYSALIINDNEGIFSSLKSSHRLVWGNWWRTATVFVVPLFFFFVIYTGLMMIFGLSGWAGGFDGDVQSLMVYLVGFSTVMSAIGMPLIYSILLVQLHDLKLRKQGQDLEKRVNAA